MPTIDRLSLGLPVKDIHLKVLSVSLLKDVQDAAMDNQEHGRPLRRKQGKEVALNADKKRPSKVDKLLQAIVADQTGVATLVFHSSTLTLPLVRLYIGHATG